LSPLAGLTIHSVPIFSSGMEVIWRRCPAGLVRPRGRAGKICAELPCCRDRRGGTRDIYVKSGRDAEPARRSFRSPTTWTIGRQRSTSASSAFPRRRPSCPSARTSRRTPPRDRKITTRCHSVRSLRSPDCLSFHVSLVARDRLTILVPLCVVRTSGLRHRNRHQTKPTASCCNLEHKSLMVTRLLFPQRFA
jgi:hypothetical protein